MLRFKEGKKNYSEFGDDLDLFNCLIVRRFLNFDLKDFRY